MTLDVNDSEVLEMEKVLKTLRERAGIPRDLQNFENEIKSRFWDIGFKVDVKWWESNVEGTYIPDVEIIERVEGEFDVDKQVYEVVNNVVGLPDTETGFIKTSPKEIEMIQSGHVSPEDRQE